MLTDLILFTIELSRDRVMNSSLKAPSRLKGVDTLLNVNVRKLPTI